MKVFYPINFHESSMYGDRTGFTEAFFSNLLPKYRQPMYHRIGGDIFAECNGPGFPPYSIIEGEPDKPVLPPPRSWSDFSRPCNPNFEKRKRSGDIVTSNMHAYSVLAYVETPGIHVKPLGGNIGRNFSLGIAENYPSVQTPATAWSEFYNPFSGGVFHGHALVEYGYGEMTYSPMSSYPLDKVIDSMQALTVQKVDGNLVQEVHAKANSGTLDILTELAELPETLKWIFNSFKTARRIMLDFKNKEFSLNDRTAKRQRNLKDRISALEGLLKQPQLNKRQKEIYIRERRKLNQDLTYSIYELGQKTASLWLQFRYALMPIIYSIKDACRITFDDTVFKKYRKRESENLEVPDIGAYKFTGSAVLTKRCFIKRSYGGSSSIWSILRREFAPNVFKTLWEVTRLSFVADWFVSIGDSISSAFRSTGAFLSEASLYSYKIEIDGRYVNSVDGASIAVKSRCYNRIQINPSDYTGLYLKIDMNWMRELDAVALFVWPAIRSTFNSKTLR